MCIRDSGTQRVILGGYFAELSAWILPAAYASLGEHVFISQPIGSLVATSTLGPDAAATGAALYAVDQLLSNPTLLDGPGAHAVPAAHPAAVSYTHLRAHETVLDLV